MNSRYTSSLTSEGSGAVLVVVKSYQEAWNCQWLIVAFATDLYSNCNYLKAKEEGDRQRALGCSFRKSKYVDKNTFSTFWVSTDRPEEGGSTAAAGGSGRVGVWEIS